jgi:glutamine synthetase
MLAAGMDGIEKGLTPPAPVNKNIYHLSDQESAELGIESLPHTLSAALNALEADPVLTEALGAHITDAYLTEKRAEWAEYRAQVHQWELDQYMESF